MKACKGSEKQLHSPLTSALIVALQPPAQADWLQRKGTLYPVRSGIILTVQKNRENGTDSLPRNVGKKLQLLAA